MNLSYRQPTRGYTLVDQDLCHTGEVRGDHVRHRDHDAAGRCDARFDMCVTATERRSHETVSLGAISDHHRPLCCRFTNRRSHQRSHRFVRLTGNRGCHSRCRDDRGKDRSPTGYRSVGRRIGRVVIGADQAGPVAYGTAGLQHLVVVERAMEADDHNVDAGSCIVDNNGTSADDGLYNALATTHHDSLAWLDQQSGSVRRGQHITNGRNADGVERLLLSLDACCGIVGDEQHPVPGCAQGCNGLDRAGNRLMGQPHHTIEIAQHDTRRFHTWSCWHASCQPVGVPRFEPFAALRYSPDEPLDEVVAPPYDVLSPADIDSLLARHAHNIVAVDVPLDRDGPDRYSIAASRLATWLDDGVLVRDEMPSMTLYRMYFTDETGRVRRTVGVIGALEVVDDGADGVLPHERTTPKARTDRLDLTRATHCNLSPVWGLSLTAGLSDLLHEPGEPMGRCTDERGVEHLVERVVDPVRIDAIRSAVGANAVLIADGHHRYAISRSYRDEVRQATGRCDTDAELTMVYVAELVAEQLSIDPIHRVYRGVSADTLIASLAPYCLLDEAGTVTQRSPAEAIDREAMCLVRPDGSGVWLTPRDDAFAGVRALDGAYLEHALADLQGVDGTAIDVSYQHGVQNVIDLLRAGDADAAVLIRPTSIDEIRRTAVERLLMPPKSTYFTPKLRTGLVLRPMAS